MSAHSKRPEENEEESVTSTALMVEGDCVLDFYVEGVSYDSRHCNTNKVFSVLIDGGPGWLGHKRTYAIKDPIRT